MLRSVSHSFFSCLVALVVVTVSYALEEHGDIPEELKEQTNESQEHGIWWLFQWKYFFHIQLWITCAGLILYKIRHKKLKADLAEKAGAAEEKNEGSKKKGAKAQKKGGSQKEEKKEEKKEENEPVAPAFPGLKFSQILPMFVMLGLQKFDIAEMGYTRHVQVLFVFIQLACGCVLGNLYGKIDAAKDDGKKVAIPEVVVMGNVQHRAKKLSTKEYDMSQWKEQAKKLFIGFVIVCGICYMWGSLTPIAMQILMQPMMLYESPLFRTYFMGQEVVRPFVVDNPFASLFPAEDSKK